MQDKVRTLKSHVETEAGIAIREDAPILTWLVRWAGELISKFHTGSDRKTSHERIRGTTTKKPLHMFGKHVWYLPLQVDDAKPMKGEAKMKEGVWLGTIDRTDEYLIGIDNGVVECRAVKRRPIGEQWCGAAMQQMKGTTWQPIPGQSTDLVQTFVPERKFKANTLPSKVTVEMAEMPAEMGKPKAAMGKQVHNFRISRRDLEKHEATPGCPACTETLMGRSGESTGTVHSASCRARLRELMMADPESRARILKSEARSEQLRKELSLKKERPREEALPTEDDAAGAGDGGEPSGPINPDSAEELDGNSGDLTKVAPSCLELSADAGARMRGPLLNMSVGFVNTVKDMDVAEVYSPPRIAEMVTRMGLRGGWSLDLTTQDDEGHGWDFRDEKMKNKVARKVIRDQPL